MQSVEKQHLRPRINVLSNYHSQGPLKLSAEITNPNRTYFKHCSYSSKSLTWPSDSAKAAIRQSIESKSNPENGVSNNKGDPKLGDQLKRTASLDTYFWPQLYFRCHFMVDRATQTPDEWNDNLSPDILREENEVIDSSSSTPEPDLLQLAPNNVDGLSQEIERVLFTGFRPVKSRRSLEHIPDGHRAPIAGLFTEIWTPIPRFDDGLITDKIGTDSSPHNISRDPPDGCDKVNTLDESRLGESCSGTSTISSLPTKPVKFEPSQSSAFYPLVRTST